MRELSGAVAEEDKVMIVTMMVLGLMQLNVILLEFTGRPKSYLLMQMAFDGSAMSSVNSCETYVTPLSETHLKPRERLYIVLYSAKGRIVNNML
jgi:hypothetical protein